MKPSKAPSPASIEERLATLEAKMLFVLNAKMFDSIETQKEVDDLKRLVVSEPPREWLTVSQAAQQSGYSEVSIRYWCKNFHVGTRDRPGGPWKVHRKHLIRFLVDRFGPDRIPAGLREGNRAMPRVL
jgi:hypothetical protein